VDPAFHYREECRRSYVRLCSFQVRHRRGHSSWFYQEEFLRLILEADQGEENEVGDMNDNEFNQMLSRDEEASAFRDLGIVKEHFAFGYCRNVIRLMSRWKLRVVVNERMFTDHLLAFAAIESIVRVSLARLICQKANNLS